MNHVHLAPGLDLPVETAVQKFAFLARSGAGKTYSAGVLVEELVRTKQQVVIVDPIGVWWGLRLSADGKAPGLSIPVFGGDHGDIPLEPSGGELVAALVAEQGLSVVLDVSEFTGADQRRFVTAFATQLHHLKKRHRSPVMVVWEECQDFVPQKVGGDTAKMVGAMERLIKQGRNFGIGTALISQRPQAVNKDVLNQTEVLVVLQTNGLQERKAIEGWIVDKGLEESPLAELPKLAIGDAFVWSPQWLRLFKRVHIAPKRTYDASATPTFGAKQQARQLAPVDLEKVKTEMAATIERAKATDPKALQKRVLELEAELRRAKVAPAPKVERVEVPVLRSVQVDQLEALANKLLIAIGRAVPREAAGRPSRVTPPPPYPRAPTARRSDAEGALPPGEVAILSALIQYPGGLAREQLTVLTGYKRSSRDTYLKRLGVRGYVARDGDRLTATSDGGAALPDAQPLPKGEALQAFWLARLPEGERKILGLVISNYPSATLRDYLSDATGYKRSSRDTYLKRLAAKQLVETVDRGNVRASATLFEVGCEVSDG